MIKKPSKYGIYDNSHGWDSYHTVSACNIILDIDENHFRGELSVKRKIDWLMKNDSKCSHLDKYLARVQSSLMKYNSKHIKTAANSSLAALNSFSTDCLETQMINIRRDMHKMKKNATPFQMPPPLLDLVNILTQNSKLNATPVNLNASLLI